MHDPLNPKQFPPSVVHAIYDAWKVRVDARLEPWRRFNALWKSDYWADRGLPSDRYTDLTTAQDKQIRVEVNRIKGFVYSYLGSLFPQRLKVRYESQDDRGNDEYATRVGNRWLRRRDMAANVTEWMGQAIMYDGACLKVRVNRKAPKLRARVVSDVVPWWEAIVDRDVRSLAEQRYIGHAYYIPRAEAVKRFKDPTISGMDWTDPMLSKESSDTFSAANQATKDPARQNFVLVVEWYNFADDYILGETDPVTHRPLANYEPVLDPVTRQPIRAKGRYEVYLPNEPDGWLYPREVRLLPHVDSDEEVMWPLYPLVFNHEWGYPLRGLSTVEAAYDAFREKILVRSMAANSIKRDARQILLPKGWLDTNNKDLVSRGVDGAVLEYEQPENDNRNIAQVMAKMDFGNLPSSHDSYDAQIEDDINRAGRAPLTRGETSPYVSATQSTLANTYASTDIGMMADQRDALLERLMRHVMVAHVDVMREAGADATLTVKVRGEKVKVKADDLDGDWEVSVTSGAATAMEEDAKRQRLLAVLPVLAQILKGVEAGAPHAIILLDELVDLFDLPDALRSKLLLEAIKEAKAGMEIQPQPGQNLPGSGQLPTPEVTGPRPMPEAVNNGTAQNDGRGKPMNPGVPPSM